MSLYTLTSGKQISVEDVSNILGRLETLKQRNISAYAHLIAKCLKPEVIIPEFEQSFITSSSMGNSKKIEEYIKDVILDMIAKIKDGEKLKEWAFWTVELMHTVQVAESKDTPVLEMANALETAFLSPKQPQILMNPDSGSYVAIPDMLKNSVPSIEKAAEAPNNASVSAEILSFLANNKYKLLLAAATTSYIMYDHYHENRLGKVADSIKNNMFSLWQKSAGSSMNKKEENQEDEINFRFAGTAGL